MQESFWWWQCSELQTRFAKQKFAQLRTGFRDGEPRTTTSTFTQLLSTVVLLQVQVQCCFTSTETMDWGLLGSGNPGRPPPLSHSSWALWYFWWMCRASCPRMSVDILGTNCDQCRSTVQGCITSTGTVRSLGRGAQDGHLHFQTAPELCGTSSK